MINGLFLGSEARGQNVIIIPIKSVHNGPFGLAHLYEDWIKMRLNPFRKQLGLDCKTDSPTFSPIASKGPIQPNPTQPSSI